MIQLVFISSMVMAFFRLARKYQKLAWLFGAIGGFFSWLFATVSLIIIARFSPDSMEGKSDFVTVYKFIFLSFAASGFLCWLLYSLLEYLWKRDLSRVRSYDVLDEDV